MHLRKPVSAGLQFMSQMPRQHRFLVSLLPHLQQTDWILAAWLSGSFARGDADRWSSIDLHLLVAEPEQQVAVKDELIGLLDQAIERGWRLFDEGVSYLRGLTHIAERADVTRGGVGFSIRWTVPNSLPDHLALYAPRRVLVVSEGLSASARAELARQDPFQSPPPADRVRSHLCTFWEHLSHLPAALNRTDHLAASHLLYQARRCLLELVVALNGAQRPDAPACIKPFLGPAQLEAFEKTLVVKQVDNAAWIGQAVALIVLYRWYAPQLVELYSVPDPVDLEQTTLALLSAEVDGWPALIRTG